MLLSALLARLRPSSEVAPGPVDGVQSDAGARTTLVREHYDFIWRLLARMGLRTPDVDDAAQQVFLVTLSRDLSRIKAGSERSFLFGVALRVCKEFRRKQQRTRLEDSDSSELLFAASSPEEEAERRQSWQRLQAVMERMSDDVRAVFALYELEGMTAPEIAKLVECPLGTVASRLRRGRDIFEAAVAELTQGEER